jgi:hypothetical protein
MRSNRVGFAVVFCSAVFFSACSHLHATPVSAAPLAPDQEAQLRASLTDECGVTFIAEEGEEPKRSKGMGFYLWPDGRMSLKAFGAPMPPYTYTLQGRNMILEGKRRYASALRVDEYEGDHFTFFNYDTSQTITCIKQVRKQK